MHINLSKEMSDLLLKVAKKLNHQPQDLAIEALEHYLEDQYDYYVGIENYQRYLASGKKGTDLDDLKKELGFDND
jgi:predicted DNA-binding protein